MPFDSSADDCGTEVFLGADWRDEVFSVERWPCACGAEASVGLDLCFLEGLWHVLLLSRLALPRVLLWSA